MCLESHSNNLGNPNTENVNSTKYSTHDSSDHKRKKFKQTLKDHKSEQCFKPAPNSAKQELEPPRKEIRSYVALMDDNYPLSAAEEARNEKRAQQSAAAAQGYYNESKEKGEKKEEDLETLCNTSEQTEEGSKAFMESIGSWINDLFHASTKVPGSVVKPGKLENPKDATLENGEHMKVLTAINKRYQKNLKNETSVHVTAPNKPFEFNFDDDFKPPKRKVKCHSSPQPITNSEFSTKRDELSETLQFLGHHGDARECSRRAVLRPREVLGNLFPAENINNVNSFLVKEKKRYKTQGSDNKQLKEYVLPTPSDLSKRILLNINIQDKGTHVLKSTHLRTRNQHYRQGKKTAYQVNSRWYTTNANPKENFDGSSTKISHKNLQYCTSPTSKARGSDEILSRNSMDIKKYMAHRWANVSDPSKDSMTVSKMKHMKSLTNLQAEAVKCDTKTPSDELVRYLMKKIKTNPRLNHAKKKPNVSSADSTTQVYQVYKNKIKRSATNNIVMKIAAKSDVHMCLRNDPRALPENKVLANKEIHVKYPDNMRFDVSRAVNPSKFNRCSYLCDYDRVDDDRYLLEKNNSRNARQFSEIFSKRNEKKVKKEFPNNTSKVEPSFVDLPKPKLKEVKKEIEPEVSEINMTEVQMARFRKQHELFKTTFKTAGLLGDLDLELPEPKPEKPAEQTNNNLLPAEFADSRTTLQLAPVEKDKIMKPTTVTTFVKEPECKISDLSVDKKPFNLKVEKKVPEKFFSKNKNYKMKSSLLVKDDTKILLNNVGELCNVENKYQKESPKNLESLYSADIRTGKTTETAFFNRRYSTTPQSEATPKEKPAFMNSPYVKNFYLPDAEERSSNKEAKDKKDKTKFDLQAHDYNEM